jgi:hypothetical protein
VNREQGIPFVQNLYGYCLFIGFSQREKPLYPCRTAG